MVAQLARIAYPPALLLLVLFLFVFVASLYFSVVISRPRQQIERLVEEVAILAARQREQGNRGGREEKENDAVDSGREGMGPTIPGG